VKPSVDLDGRDLASGPTHEDVLWIRQTVGPWSASVLCSVRASSTPAHRPVRLFQFDYVAGGRRLNQRIGRRRARGGPAQSQTGSATMKPTMGIDSAVTIFVSLFTLRDPACHGALRVSVLGGT
jgi:hypothetical protein